jgi:hypothetical protein
LFGQGFRDIHTAWLEKDEEEDATAAEVPAEIETPVAFVPQDLPTADIPSSVLQGTKPPSIIHDVESSSETFVNIPATAISSPTLSISTISDLTPTELGDEIEHSEGQMTACHGTFYFEDGNVEILCGDTMFRVHSTTISFSSPKLRDMLSRSSLLNAPMPEGCPRIVFADNAEDFAVLLKMIYMPGYVPSPFDVGSVN